MSTQSPSSPDLFLLDCSEDFHSFALKLLAQSRRNICILSRDLDPAIFNTEEFVDAISQIARNNRNAQVQVLVKDTQPLLENGHKLVKLAQRLPSKINIRKLTQEPDDKKMGFILCDTHSLVYKNDEAAYKGFANYNAAAEVKHFREIFDYIWQYAETEPELQQLHI
ncbi:MAG: hypothetical protein V4732_06120 [Pseudomonadota bacterium]